MEQRRHRLILLVAFCMTTLGWSVAFVGATQAQEGLNPDQSTNAKVKSTIAIPLPQEREEVKTKATRHRLHHDSSPTDTHAIGRGRDSLNFDRISTFPITSQLADFSVYTTKVMALWSGKQFSIERSYDQRDTSHHFLISTPRLNALMPLDVNRHVQRILDYYQHKIHNRFQKYLDRYEKYKEFVQRTFKKTGLPPELGYLSLVESGFNTRAFSRARASGPWQFMKATGREYGLDVTWYVDERRDPVKSTRAAAQHLKDLFGEFKSWPLALAAYNAGTGKIQRAIRKSGSRNFWKIRETWYIKQETKDYVPSFIAAVLIASNPTQYGFKVSKATPYAYDIAFIHKRVHLEAVATATGISIQRLRELNPELLQTIVPIVEDGYVLKVPKGKGDLVEEHHDTIKMWTKLPPDSATWYRVSYGDTLHDVAQRFGLSVRDLRRLNNLKEEDRIRWNDRLRLRTDDDSAPLPLEVEPALPATWYRVHFGDTLASIAKKFGLSVKELKRLNNLKEDRIKWNTRLRVRTDDESAPLPLEVEPAPPATWYRVHFGDTLVSVAQKFGLSVQELKELNNLKEDRIKWNTRLRVRGEDDDNPSLVPHTETEVSPTTTWYRIQSGDTLSSIAKEFGLSVQEIKELNNLEEDRIRSGDRLRLKIDDEKTPIALEAKSASPATWYRVHYGDTLASVAKKFGLSVKELKRLNDLKEDRLRWNTRLRVSGKPPLAPQAEPTEPAEPSESTSPATWYRVHFGDTLASVAKQFGLSIKELKRLNDLKEDRLRWNTRLRVSGEPPLAPQAEPTEPAEPSESTSAATWYRVHFGDTLASVAKQFGLSVKELKRLNGLKEDRIKWNTKLRVRPADKDDSPVALNSEKDKS